MTRLLGLAMMLMFATYGASFLGLFDLPYPTQILDKVQKLDASTAKRAVQQHHTARSGSFTSRVSNQPQTTARAKAVAVQPVSESFTNRISRQGQKLSQADGAAVLRQNMLAAGQQKLFFEG